MHVAVCWKWLGANPHAPRGISPADEAALEVALHLAGDDGTVSTWCAGSAPAGDALRMSVACGATVANRLEATGAEPSHTVAVALASAMREHGGIDAVVCGNHSLDRGSGSVPAFIAAALGWPQALGLISVDAAPGRTLTAIRRLDQGRRERLAIELPFVASVEGATARLRRASLSAVRAAAGALITTSAQPLAATEPEQLRPFQPRAHVVAAPVGDDALQRVRRLADRDDSANAATVEELAPDAAARRITELLRGWGYLTAT